MLEKRTENEKKTFSACLRKAMEKKGVTSVKLAEDIGVTKLTISNWLNMKGFPLSSRIDLLEKYFGVEIVIEDDTVSFVEKEKGARKKNGKENGVEKLEKELPENCLCFPSLEEITKKPFIVLVSTGTKPEEVEGILKKISEYVRAV